MRFTISGKNIEVTQGLRDAILEKLGKLDKYLSEDTEVIVTLSVEKARQKIEVTIPVKGNIIRAEQACDDMYVSIDLVEEVIERQMRIRQDLSISSMRRAIFRKHFWIWSQKKRAQLKLSERNVLQ